MNPLSIFGLFAVTFTLACYALENRGRQYVLGFAAGCVMSSIYGFLQGAWPFGLIEIAWTLVAMRRWRQIRPVK